MNENIFDALPPELADLAKAISSGKNSLPEGIEERIKLKLIALLEEVERDSSKDKDALERISLTVDILKRIKEAL